MFCLPRPPIGIGATFGSLNEIGEVPDAALIEEALDGILPLLRLVCSVALC